ncbi:MAG: cupin, partial [Geminicoccaceae bacterium]|nr:cupin [Geminicoccaceae bacterium]
LEEGDLFDIPTGIFRGFENIGTDYGMIMAVLGGDDAGGGVIWAPQVIEDAREHGLVLAKTGKLYDSKKGQSLPPGVEPMPLLTEEELLAFPEVAAADVVPHFVARYGDMRALSARAPARVLGDGGMIDDRPGFEVDFLQQGQKDEDQPYVTERHEVLLVHRGHWRLSWAEGAATLAPGDTCAVPPNLERTLRPSMAGEAALFRVRPTDDPAGPTKLRR